MIILDSEVIIEILDQKSIKGDQALKQTIKSAEMITQMQGRVVF